MDYRKSHTSSSKGQDYDKSFSISDYRQFVLSWEKDVLDSIVSDIVEKKDNYLDFACGTGRITTMIEQSFKNAYGIDVSESMISEAKKKVKKAEIIHKDITVDNPFTEGQMDLITSFRFFLNAEGKLRSDVLAQLNKVLSKDGYFVFNIHNNRTLLTIIINKLATIKKKMEGKSFEPQNSISYREVVRLLRDHGFKIEHTFHRVITPLKSEKTRIKISRLATIENLFSKIGPAKYISRNIIFVCKKV